MSKEETRAEADGYVKILEEGGEEAGKFAIALLDHANEIRRSLSSLYVKAVSITAVSAGKEQNGAAEDAAMFAGGLEACLHAFVSVCGHYFERRDMIDTGPVELHIHVVGMDEQNGHHPKKTPDA
jgi:hypothetical protein